MQRVKRASVTVNGCKTGQIAKGLCVFAGFAIEDGSEDVAYIVDKVCNLRIFTDSQGKMNRSVLDCEAAILVVSQFTLYGDVRKGRRPAFVRAMKPPAAELLYESAISRFVAAGVSDVQTGTFRADMDVELVNDGPVTILLDSERGF